MKVKVNLLQESQKIQLKIRRIGLVMQTVSTIVLIGFGSLAILLLSYTLFIGSQQKKVLAEIESTENQVEELRVVEYKHELLKNKLVLASKALEEHKINHKLVTDFYEFAKTRLNITEVAVGENSTKFRFQGSADGVVALVEFLADLEDFGLEKGIESVQSDGFSLTDEGTYDFGLTINFLEV